MKKLIYILLLSSLIPQFVYSEQIKTPEYTNANAVTAIGAAGFTLTENKRITLDPTVSADSLFSGLILPFLTGAVVHVGKLVYFKSDSLIYETSATDTTAGGIQAVGIATASAQASVEVPVLLYGVARSSALALGTLGAEVWMATAAGGVTETVPIATGNAQRKIGYTISASNDIMMFQPSIDYTKAK